MQEVKQPSKRPLVFYYLIGMLILMVLNMTFFPSVLQKQVQEVSYSTFMSMTMDDNIGKVQIEGEEITFTDKAQENIYKTTAIDSDTGMVQRVYDHGGDINRVDTQPGLLTSILVGWVLPLLPFLLIGWFINRRMKKSMGGDGMMFGMGGGSNAKMYVPSSTGIRFADVAGEDEAKELLSEIVDFLRDPEKYSALGARIPKGVLLVGPPGTGKTLLARAVAGESGVTFIQKNATEFFKSMVGEGPGAVREVFRIARKYAPTVLFVDEIDAIGEKRSGESVHAAEELQNTFLSELDGFAFDEKRPVFLLAATNYDIDAQGGGQRVLDPAFVRRFDRSVKIELPNTEERRQFLQYYLKKHGIRGIREETLDSLAARSIGRSPADLERVIQYALRKRKGKRLTDRDLTLALDAERYGKEREWSEEVMRKTSLHEAGHAVVSWLCGEVPEYLTNISRGDFGGYMQRKTEDGRFGYTRQELCDRICCSLAGRAAEGEFYGDEGVTTGASGDLERASELARAIVCRLGMAEDGDLLVLSAEEETEEVRSRIRSLLRAQAERAALLVRENRDAVESLAEELLKKNSLTHAELAAFFEARQKNI